MNVDDVALVLHHHWVHDISIFPDELQRIYLATMILVQAYTATRPRVIAYTPLCKESIDDHYYGPEKPTSKEYATEWDDKDDDLRVLSYRDIKLFMLPGPPGGRSLPVMEMTLRYTKGWKRREVP